MLAFLVVGKHQVFSCGKEDRHTTKICTFRCKTSLKPNKKVKMETVKPYTTSLHRANAYWMAEIAKAAYFKLDDDAQTPDTNRIFSYLTQKDPRFLSVEGYTKNSAQAIIVEHEDYLCMGFRGTDEIADWLDNLNIISIDALFGEFHKGFYMANQDVWEPIFRKYRQLRNAKRRPLFITGHSLGGAMATVAVARLVHQDLPFSSCYTFGQPRVMTRDTSRVFNLEAKSRFFRFQNNNDLVTRVPARLSGYSHVGTFLYISEEKVIHNDPGFWFRFVDAIDGATEAIGERGIDMIEDHDMEDYLAAIQSWNCDF